MTTSPPGSTISPARLGEPLLRVKGLVRVTGQPRPVLVQSVGTMFSPPRLFAGEQIAPSFIVVIAQDTAPTELAEVSPSSLFRIGTPNRRGASSGPLRAEQV